MKSQFTIFWLILFSLFTFPAFAQVFNSNLAIYSLEDVRESEFSAYLSSNVNGSVKKTETRLKQNVTIWLSVSTVSVDYNDGRPVHNYPIAKVDKYENVKHYVTIMGSRFIVYMYGKKEVGYVNYITASGSVLFLNE